VTLAVDRWRRFAGRGYGDWHAEKTSRRLTPFRQIDGILQRKYEGAGLGLPLAKRYIERNRAARFRLRAGWKRALPSRSDCRW